MAEIEGSEPTSVPPAVHSILRQWPACESVKEQIDLLREQLDAKRIEVLLVSVDLGETRPLHETSPDSDSFWETSASLRRDLCMGGKLRAGVRSGIKSPGNPDDQWFCQVFPPQGTDGCLVVLICVSEISQDPFLTTTCSLGATLLHGSVVAELANEALERTERILQQSQRLSNVGQLVTGVAHDFNNLLTVIQGNLALIECEGTNRRETLQSTRKIKEATHRAVELSRQLLTLGKEQKIEFEDCDLNTILRNFGQLVDRVLEENIEVSFEYGEEIGLIHADAGMVTQILMNLVVNARDAMPQGGTLSISTERQSLSEERNGLPAGDYVSLRVRDTGSGIPRENLSRIFDPFFSTKDHDKGTGLGLANVADIMRRHGGAIDVSSEEGRGTEFELLFPVKAADALQSPSTSKTGRERESSRLSTLRSDLGGIHVLLVEDENSVRKLVRKLLEMIGCKVTESTSGKDALERWPSLADDISIVVSDVMMPGGVSGWELARQIHERNPQLGILLTSGYDERPEDHGLEGVAEVSFLQKPYDVSRLKEELQSLTLAS